MKRRRTKNGQNRSKSAYRRGPYVPAPQIARIRLRYLAGQSNREIAFAEARHQDTISRIIRTTDFADYMQKLQDAAYDLAPEAMVSLRAALKVDFTGKLSYGLLKDLGVIPSAANSISPGINQHHQTPESSEDDAVLRESIKFGLLTHHQAKIFNQPLPEMDEVEVPEATIQKLKRVL